MKSMDYNYENLSPEEKMERQRELRLAITKMFQVLGETLVENAGQDWDFIINNVDKPEEVLNYFYDIEFRKSPSEGSRPTSLALMILKFISEGDGVLKSLQSVTEKYLSDSLFDDLSFHELIRQSVPGHPSTEKAEIVYPLIKQLLKQSRGQAVDYFEEVAGTSYVNRLKLLNGLSVIANNDTERESSVLTYLLKFLELERERIITYNNPLPISNTFYLSENFDFKFVKTYLEVLPNNKSKLSYLFEIKANFLQKVLEIKQNYPEKLFLTPFAKQCDIEIEKLKAIHETNTIVEVEENQKTEDNESIEGSLRQKVFALLLLIYGKLEIPTAKEDLRTQTINFVEFITGNSHQTVKVALQKGTSYKEGSEKSRNAILKDLREVRRHLRALDLKQEKLLTAEAKAILGFESDELDNQ